MNNETAIRVAELACFLSNSNPGCGNAYCAETSVKLFSLARRVQKWTAGWVSETAAWYDQEQKEKFLVKSKALLADWPTVTRIEIGTIITGPCITVWFGSIEKRIG